MITLSLILVWTEGNNSNNLHGLRYLVALLTAYLSIIIINNQ